MKVTPRAPQRPIGDGGGVGVVHRVDDNKDGRCRCVFQLQEALKGRCVTIIGLETPHHNVSGINLRRWALRRRRWPLEDLEGRLDAFRLPCGARGEDDHLRFIEAQIIAETVFRDCRLLWET